MGLKCLGVCFSHAHPGSPYVYGLAEANIDLDVSEEVFVVGMHNFFVYY